MGLVTKTDFDTSAFILEWLPQAIRTDEAVLLQDAGRGAADLVCFTLLGKIAATGKYAPYSAAATDGSAMKPAIYLGPNDILAADIVAGDVTGLSVLEFGAIVDEGKLVLEAGTLDTLVGTGVTTDTVRNILEKLSIKFRETENIHVGA